MAHVNSPPPRNSRPSRPPRVVTVEEVLPLSPGLIRIVFTGAGLTGFEAGSFTDHYVKLHFPPAGASYGPPFDPAEIRSTLPRAEWSRTRTYTVRRWDSEALRLTIDFVVHGDEGVAGPWARGAKPGDRLQLVGPGGAYRPDPGVRTHLLVGDESALPAIAAALEQMPEPAVGHVVVQVPGSPHEIALPAPSGVGVTWLHGDEPSPVLALVERLTMKAPVQAFVHGEAELVRVIRRHLLGDLRLDRELVSASGYWKRERTEDGWRDDKPEWNRLVETDLARVG
jgi:NADPH-dependent ferric siderophore reductase